MKASISIISFAFLLLACSSKKESPLFEEVSKESGLVFVNELPYTEDLNPYTYRNFYNGAGVALGDVNNDGLLDVYMTGNLTDNKLFVNKGNWQFEDVSIQAGVNCPNIWSTGATFVDINADGWLDLYVCKSGPPNGENRHNELFINQKNGTFTEESAQYGLNFTGLSTHAAFFDFDKDGDLDCYLLNNSIRSVGVGQDVVEGRRLIPDQTGNGNKFLRNDNGVFQDITLEAGIYSSSIGYGLGITLNDFNNDGWTDIFISNDFFEKDYLYINNQNGGFNEDGENYFQSLSMGSMGADASDLNNDGNPELMVTEMLPADIQRKKTKTFHETWDKYQLNVSKGYYHQFSRNVLQTNIGNNKYSEVGRLSGVAATEWSWGALIFDMDNDGMKDIFISNGIYKDLLDRDYLNYMANEERVRSMLKEDGQAIKKMVDLMPSSPISNAAYLNQGNLHFKSSSEALGLGMPSFSNGSAYGDLDNDGDLDLIVNNVNMPSFVYKNTSDTSKNKSIKVQLKGNQQNTFGIGAKITAYTESGVLTAENYPSKGFQSSVDPIIHLGLGAINKVDSLYIQWPEGGITKAYGLASNQTYSFDEAGKKVSTAVNRSVKIPIQKSTEYRIDFKHAENDFVGFDRERLLFQMYDNEGPHMSLADVNNDGQQDLYIGGAKQQSGALFLGERNGFSQTSSEALSLDSISEDTHSLFFDCDNDGDQDLYVSSGGRAFSKSSSALTDRLYINDGKGNFTKSTEALPFTEYISTSIVKAADYDQDGDLDLFVGERFHPYNYGRDGRGFVFQNDGKGKFTDVTETIAPELKGIGMVTDAEWADIDGNGTPDLITVGDWQPINVFLNQGGKRLTKTVQDALSQSSGLWTSLEVADIDNDGDLDFVAGNHGTNSFLKPKLKMYINDFDGNGTPEQIICEENNGKYYPIAEIDELIRQMPILKKKSIRYTEFAKLSIDELFTPEQLSNAKITEADLLTSSLFINNKGEFTRLDLPTEAQYSPVYAIASMDLNKDGFLDLILGGNQFLVKPQIGRFDGSKGLILMGSKEGYKSKNATFLTIDGQIRDIKTLTLDYKTLILFAVNDAPIEIYETTEN